MKFLRSISVFLKKQSSAALKCNATRYSCRTVFVLLSTVSYFSVVWHIERTLGFGYKKLINRFDYHPWRENINYHVGGGF